MALWSILNIMRYEGANMLVVRNVYNTMRDSCFAQLKWAIKRLEVDDYWKATENPLELRYLPTGQKIIFRGFDDPDKLASTTVESGYLCWVWVEEAFEIASEEAFVKFDLSVPRGNVPPPLFKQTMERNRRRNGRCGRYCGRRCESAAESGRCGCRHVSN